MRGEPYLICTGRPRLPIKVSLLSTSFKGTRRATTHVGQAMPLISCGAHIQIAEEDERLEEIRSGGHSCRDQGPLRGGWTF